MTRDKSSFYHTQHKLTTSEKNSLTIQDLDMRPPVYYFLERSSFTIIRFTVFKLKDVFSQINVAYNQFGEISM